MASCWPAPTDRRLRAGTGTTAFAANRRNNREDDVVRLRGELKKTKDPENRRDIEEEIEEPR